MAKVRKRACAWFILSFISHCLFVNEAVFQNIETFDGVGAARPRAAPSIIASAL
jgi:hypothetical protein